MPISAARPLPTPRPAPVPRRAPPAWCAPSSPSRLQGHHLHRNPEPSPERPWAATPSSPGRGPRPSSRTAPRARSTTRRCRSPRTGHDAGHHRSRRHHPLGTVRAAASSARRHRCHRHLHRYGHLQRHRLQGHVQPGRPRHLHLQRRAGLQHPQPVPGAGGDPGVLGPPSAAAPPGSTTTTGPPRAAGSDDHFTCMAGHRRRPRGTRCCPARPPP